MGHIHDIYSANISNSRRRKKQFQINKNSHFFILFFFKLFPTSHLTRFISHFLSIQNCLNYEKKKTDKPSNSIYSNHKFIDATKRNSPVFVTPALICLFEGVQKCHFAFWWRIFYVFFLFFGRNNFCSVLFRFVFWQYIIRVRYCWTFQFSMYHFHTNKCEIIMCVSQEQQCTKRNESFFCVLTYILHVTQSFKCSNQKTVIGKLAVLPKSKSFLNYVY